MLRADTVQKAFTLSSEAVHILKDAGFNLRKLRTNSRELQLLWNRGRLGDEAMFEEGCKLKVLGLIWDLEDDWFGVDVTPLLNSLKLLRNTKRSVLSTEARVFIPVGFICPFVVRIKKLMQEIWERGVDWDSESPGDLRVKWERWYSEIGGLGEVRVDRCFFHIVKSNCSQVEMHIFCDASQVSYGPVAYLRWILDSGEVKTSFVMAKSRVAPLKNLTLPKLELMGTLLGARLWKYLSTVFKNLVKRVVMWTDSEIGLYWIRGSARDWKQFASNRVMEFLKDSQ